MVLLPIVAKFGKWNDIIISQLQAKFLLGGVNKKL